MPDETTRIVQRFDTDGAEEAVGKLDKVDAAQRRVAGEAEDVGKKSEDAANKQEKLNTSTEDLTSLLSRIDPRLGALADTLFKSSKVVGDLADQQLNLGKATEAATNFLKNNANALKLLAAGGAAALGIYALVSAYQRMKEELEEVNRAMDRQSKLQTELRDKEREQQQTIEDIADSRRRLGGITAEESQRALELAESIQKEFPQLRPENINRVAGLTAGLGLSRQEVLKASVAQQLGALDLTPELSEDQIRARLRATTQRETDRITQFIGRERAQGDTSPRIQGELLGELRRELSAQRGGTSAKRRAIRILFGELPEEEVNRLLLQLDETPSLQDLRTHPKEIATRERPLQQIDRQRAEQFFIALQQAAEAVRDQARQPTVVKIEAPNSRWIGPDAHSQQRRMRNGEKILQKTANRFR